MLSRVIVILPGAVLTVLLSLVNLHAVEISLISPVPIYLFFAEAFLGVGSVVVIPTLFFVCNLLVWRLRSSLFFLKILLAIYILTLILYFFFGVDSGLRVQGYFHTVSVVIMNIISLLVLSFLLFFKGEIYNREYVFTSMLCIFLAWFSFPYLGEIA